MRTGKMNNERETMILTKDEAELILKIRKEEEEYQKMMHKPIIAYTHKDDGKTKIRFSK